MRDFTRWRATLRIGARLSSVDARLYAMARDFTRWRATLRDGARLSGDGARLYAMARDFAVKHGPAFYLIPFLPIQ